MARRIAIIGGGLAGLATAAALAHFGIEADVFEQTAKLGEIGAGINVSPQAVQALRAIGLGASIAAVANIAAGTLTRDLNSGATLNYRDQTSAAARFGAGVHSFHRADLLTALASGVDPRAIHLGCRLTGLEERSDTVRLMFADGVTREADLVIGADGVHSLVRRFLYGEDHPTYTGQMVWRALLPGAVVPAEVMQPSGHVQWLGRGRHFFAYYLRGREVVNIVTQEDTDAWVDEGWSIPGDPDAMRASFADPEPLLAALLGCVTQCSKWGLFTRPLTGDWGRGRIALIGDAAHAMLPNAGQGASQPVLRRCLYSGPLACRARRRDRGLAKLSPHPHSARACGPALLNRHRADQTRSQNGKCRGGRRRGPHGVDLGLRCYLRLEHATGRAGVRARHTSLIIGSRAQKCPVLGLATSQTHV